MTASDCAANASFNSITSMSDSFNPAIDGLLDCPHYTRPEEWQGRKVPAELLSGHHAQIERWRRDRRLEATARLRPDLLRYAPDVAARFGLRPDQEAALEAEEGEVLEEVEEDEEDVSGIIDADIEKEEP